MLTSTLFLSGTCLFLAIAAITYHYTKNLIIPFVGWMLLIGTMYGLSRERVSFFAEWPDLILSPDIVLHLLVPLLVFETGRKFRIRDFEEERVPIIFFSIFGVIATVFLIGFPISYLLQIPIEHGLLLGAILAPTDPVAVNAIFVKVRVPKHLRVQMEGESIFNDATGVIIFTMMFGIAIENQELAPDNAILYFLQSIGLGMIVGSVLGWLVATLLNTWKDNELAGTILTLSLAIAASIITETVFHASGIIGALFSAMVFMRTERQMSKSEWKTFDNFWDQVAVVANSVLFFLLGSTLGAVEFDIRWYLLGAVAVLALSRAIIIYGGGLLLRVVRMKIPLSWQNILYLGGVRGAISVALLLTVPDDYVYRGEFLSIAFTIILFTLLVHPVLIRWYLTGHELAENDSVPNVGGPVEEKYRLNQD